jgi:hypothetical protein
LRGSWSAAVPRVPGRVRGRYLFTTEGGKLATMGALQPGHIIAVIVPLIILFVAFYGFRWLWRH